MPVLEHIDIRKPEACWQERTFVPAHAVVGLIRGITANEAVPHEIPLDRRDGPLHTRIVGWQEAYQGNAQHAGVEHVVIKGADEAVLPRSEEHTSELQSLMRSSYAVFCLKKKKK